MIKKGLVGVLLLWTIACTKSEKALHKPPLFYEIEPHVSGLSFTNNLTTTSKLNIIDFTYFYNGGGVAAADFNNDGLEDLFFVANQTHNKLFLNKGNLKFEDISEKAGIHGASEWNTGVTVADVNADGYMDIYVCGVDSFNGLKSKNELYINNGDLTFSEKSEEYGLNFSTHATQATFFDYDRDGDLDFFLLNYALEESENYVPLKRGRVKNEYSGDYLLENKEGKFVDVSEQAGILQSKIGFGLSVSISDFNNDGWNDIYVANDFHEDDYFYVNQQDGTFKESGREFFGHFSRFSMGSDVADINNDGYMDILNLDMYPEDRVIEKQSVGEDPYEIYNYKLSYGYHNQYAKNSLQLNHEGKVFSDIASYSGIAATDWSWGSLFADFDNDGIKDLVISNGIPKRPNDLDFIDFVLNYQKRDPSTVDLDIYLKEALSQMPEGSYHDYLYKGTDSLRFIDKSTEWGFTEKTVSNGMVYSDLDNDGDLDLVFNRLNENAIVYENKINEHGSENYLQVQLRGQGKNRNGIGSKVTLFTKSDQQTQELFNTRGFQSAVGNKLHFGTGNIKKIDSIIIEWSSGQLEKFGPFDTNRLITLGENSGQPIFKKEKVHQPLFERADVSIKFEHQENNFNDFSSESLMPFKVSTEGPAMTVADVNADGLQDIYFGGARNQVSELWLQELGGNFTKKEQIPFEKNSILEEVDAIFFDADNDGDLDLYSCVAGNEFYGEMKNQQDQLYENDGNGNFTLATDRLPKLLTHTSCVRPYDFDNDGDLDLFVGGRVVAKSYGLIPSSYLLENDGKGNFKDVTLEVSSDLQKIGMVTDATWYDYNSDGAKDLLVTGDWMATRVFFNIDGKLKKSEQISPSGLWKSITTADIDSDGDIDILLGNLGLNTKFFKNGKQAIKMYLNDFDKNGSLEQLVSYEIDGKWYPVEGRAELGKPLPGIIKKRFNSHEEFSNKSIEEIFTKDELEDTKIRSAEMLSSIVLKNEREKGFTQEVLPAEVNFSTAFSFLPTTIKNQTYLLSAGNFYGVNTWQNRYDASYGTTLNSINGRLKEIKNSGFFVKGEVRGLDEIVIDGERHIVVARNNAVPIFFKTVE